MENLPVDVRKSSTVAIPRVSVYRFASDNPDLTISDAVVLSFVFFCIREGHGVCYASDESIVAQFGRSLTPRTVERGIARLVEGGYLIREVDQKRPEWCKRVLHPGPKVEAWAPSYSSSKALQWLNAEVEKPSAKVAVGEAKPAAKVAMGGKGGSRRSGERALAVLRKAQTGLSGSAPSGNPGTGQTYSKRQECKLVHPTGGKPTKSSSCATSGQEVNPGRVESAPVADKASSLTVSGAVAASGESEPVGVGEVSSGAETLVLGQEESKARPLNPSADLAFAWAAQVEGLTGVKQLKPGVKEFVCAKRLLAVATKAEILATGRKAYLAAVAGGGKTRFWVITDICDLAAKWARLAGWLASGDGFRIGVVSEQGPGLAACPVANGKPSTRSRAILAPAWRDNVDGF